MIKQNFLIKLKKEGKLNLVESSEEICKSYLEKADKCLKSAKILLENELFENSISMSYYSMYNTLIALFFRVGIKCENHSASIHLLKELFNKDDLYKLMLFAKEERIDKQYYVNSETNVSLTKDSTKDMINKAETLTLQLKLLIKTLNNEEIDKIKVAFQNKIESS